MALGGSAPGHDGVPYEVLQAAAHLVAGWLGQVRWAACKKRLAAALWASAVGPRIEPCLAQLQTAKRGGNCGTSLRAVFRQVGAAPAEEGEADPRADPRSVDPARCAGTLPGQHNAPSHPLLVAALGPVAGAAAAIGQAVSATRPGHDAAVTFADQEQAFERLGHQWVLTILAKWGMPLWLRRLVRLARPTMTT